MTGSWNSQITKSDSNDIILYVSNLSIDISRAENLQTGDLSTPFVDLMKAIKIAYQKGVAYSSKADGSITVVRIVLFTGNHFVLKKKYDNSNGMLNLNINRSNVPSFKEHEFQDYY